ncbi:MAG TPA: hypothetical protein VLA99_07165 [Nitrospiraceae bacterium]|nr:hypothetical protein [Nitrospiraceae bacterium]
MLSELRALLAAFEEGSAIPLLAEYADSYQGICTGDFPHFGRYFWELPNLLDGWVLQQAPVDETCFYGGMENILLWENGTGTLYKYLCERLGEQGIGAWIRGRDAWGYRGIAVRQMRALPVALYDGAHFDNNVAVIIPKIPEFLPPIWTFCASDQFSKAVRRIDQKLNVPNQTLLKVPFDLAHWKQVAAQKYPNGLPEPYSDDPTQWLFHGHPCGSVLWDEANKRFTHGPLRTDATVLQVAVARLLGYRWPAELDTEMRLGSEARAWIAKCKELDGFADADGVVCPPSVRGERPGVDRLRAILATAYGSGWSPAKEAELLAAVEFGGKSLDEWLRDSFFVQHCQLFHQRPFIWHIWDGRKKDGFHALVNYHKLDHRLLEKLTYTYLGDWIARQEAAVKTGEPTAEARLTAAKELQRKLALILEGEPPYDIFVRWKPLEQQPIGWNPDLNDGVRLNIRPFVEAGVIRKTPNIKWGKDRGKNPPGSPCGDIRDNDQHLTLAEKRQVSAAAGAKGTEPEKRRRSP